MGSTVVRLKDYRQKKCSHNLDFAQCCDKFQRWLDDGEKSSCTIASYLSDLRCFARWFEDGQQEQPVPEAITSTDLREYKRHLIEKNRKPTTVNRHLSTISCYLRWAHEKGLLQALPRIPKQLKQQQPTLRWLDRREQNALLRKLERFGKLRDLAIVRLLLNTGLREAELVNLRWSDVEVSDRKGLLVVRSGKGAKRREIPLNPDARSALCQLGYLENVGRESPIVMGQRGPLTCRGLRRMIEKYKDRNLPDLTAHSLRHTFCKNLIDAGAGLERVATLAGHESLDTTRRYCTPSLSDLQKTVDLIGEEEPPF